jgi:hypothetical protein
MGKNNEIEGKEKSYLHLGSNYPQSYSQEEGINHNGWDSIIWYKEGRGRRLIKQKLVRHIYFGHKNRVESTYQHRLLLLLLNY